jgi:DNA-binding Xre family transcriptional regulator
MIKIIIAEMAEKRGLKNAYALQKALNCSPTMASRLWKGEFSQIGIETIDSLCELFQCLPSDLLVFRSKDKSTRMQPEKPARELLEVEKIAPGEMMLTTHEVAERLGLSRKSVNDFINQGRLKAKKGKQNHNFVAELDFEEFRKSRVG